jgi:hypothetical protein
MNYQDWPVYIREALALVAASLGLMTIIFGLSATSRKRGDVERTTLRAQSGKHGIKGRWVPLTAIGIGIFAVLLQLLLRIL